jgi:hypothetical protein
MASILLLYYIFNFLRGLERSATVSVAVAAIQFVFLILTLAGACLFTIGLTQTARNEGYTDVNVYAYNYSVKFMRSTSLLQASLGASWAAVSIWLISTVVEGLSYVANRGKSSGLGF